MRADRDGVLHRLSGRARLVNVAVVQGRLAAAGYACSADGVMGAMTYAALLGYAARRALGPLGQALGVAIEAGFPAYGIAGDLEMVHWIAQAAHETEGFRFLTEQGGAAYFARYDVGTPLGEALGNTRPGDGAAFIGRGLFQISGRWNYAHFGAAVGEPLLDNPALAAQPGIAVKLACAFWRERRIGASAEVDDCEAVTRLVNGGLGGLADRQAATDRLKALCGL